MIDNTGSARDGSAKAAPLRILLADDHEGLKALVNAEPDMLVVGEAGEGGSVCRLAMALQPDVVVMDLSMPSMGGAEATTRVQVGPLVLNNDFRHPAVLAREAAALADLSAGRFELGLGAGYVRAEYERESRDLDTYLDLAGCEGEARERARMLGHAFGGLSHSAALSRVGGHDSSSRRPWRRRFR